VGAVVVRHGQVIATGRNAPVDGCDPTAHAEVIALRAAAKALGNYRLDECELYVTLEPCAMCSGAMLHARLKRVVFGAPEPKTGAAGSVLNLFSLAQLNHQTALQGGLLAEESTALLQTFFRQRRDAQREEARLSHPLREDALRTPDTAFLDLPDYPWQPHYISDLPALAGLRMHYLDQPGAAGAAPDAGLTYLCLHGQASWSHAFRSMIPALQQAGHRVVAPDLIGFGKSDKPKKEGFHSFDRQLETLLELTARLDLSRVVLVTQDWGAALGLSLLMAEPQRYQGLLVCASLSMDAQECAADNAPFPDKGHQAALRAFAAMTQAFEDSQAIAIVEAAREFWQQDWNGQTLIAAGPHDPVFALPVVRELAGSMAEGRKSLGQEIAAASEPSEALARAALGFFQP
jgi:tRNA(adenine34) deaminase